MQTVRTEAKPSQKAHEVLRRAGNPFRNYFARNPDDDVCGRFHVPELYATERQQLLAVVDLYRYDSTMHSEIVPVLGNKGAGKTHLLHSIKHGGEGAWQLLVTPGTYQKDTNFLEYLLYQVIDTLLGGGTQKGLRPLAFVGEALVSRMLQRALQTLTPEQRVELFPAPGLGRWTRRFGLGTAQAQERTQWLMETLARPNAQPGNGALLRACAEVSLEPEVACALLVKYSERTEAHDTLGMMHRHIHQGLAKATLLNDESDLAEFLTDGFADLDFRVSPSRQELVMALFKALMDVFLDLKIPVVVAFDQLEDLLLARRNDDGHRTAEAFFAGIVQVMHQIKGLCFLVFAERGLWNRFVPSLDGYIQDRLNNPIHIPNQGTIKALRLEAPAPEIVRRIVEARLRPSLQEITDGPELSSIYPFTDEQILRVARTEPTLRDMLQQYRHLFDHLVYGGAPVTMVERELSKPTDVRLPEPEPSPVIKSVIVVESTGPQRPPLQEAQPSTPRSVAPAQRGSSTQFTEAWEQTMAEARRKLEPEGSVTGATRELQAGLGAFLQACHEHGVKVGPWRLQHVVSEWTFGDHPTYGAISIGHWVCKDGQPWRVGVGLFLGRGPAKPKDLAIKLAALDSEPPMIDHLILLRPEDDLNLSGKSKSLWQEAERKGRHARLEAVNPEGFAVLYGFPRWMGSLTESLQEGQPVPNQADLLQERCEKLLEQVCMPVQAG